MESENAKVRERDGKRRNASRNSGKLLYSGTRHLKSINQKGRETSTRLSDICGKVSKNSQNTARNKKENTARDAGKLTSTPNTISSNVQSRNTYRHVVKRGRRNGERNASLESSNGWPPRNKDGCGKCGGNTKWLNARE